MKGEVFACIGLPQNLKDLKRKCVTPLSSELGTIETVKALAWVIVPVKIFESFEVFSGWLDLAWRVRKG